MNLRLAILACFLIASANGAAEPPTVKVVAFGLLDLATLEWHKTPIDGRALAEKGYELVEGSGQARYALSAVGYGCAPSEGGWTCTVRGKFEQSLDEDVSLPILKEVSAEGSAKTMNDAYDLAVGKIISSLPTAAELTQQRT